MSFTATGSQLFSNNAALALNNQGTGHLLMVEVLNFTNNTSTPTALTAGNATFTRIANRVFTNMAWTAALFMGTTTGTGAGTATPTWSAAAPSGYEITGREFISTVGSWAADGTGFVDTLSANVPYASLTPTVNGDLYWGFAGAGGAAGTGTAGYVYTANGNGDYEAYRLSCPAGVATAPGFNNSSPVGGLMALISEVSGSGAGRPQKMRTVFGNPAHLIGTGQNNQLMNAAFR